MMETDDSVSAFLEAACVPHGNAHGSGALDEAQAIATSRPEIANHNIYITGGIRRRRRRASFRRSRCRWHERRRAVTATGMR